MTYLGHLRGGEEEEDETWGKSIVKKVEALKSAKCCTGLRRIVFPPLAPVGLFE